MHGYSPLGVGLFVVGNVFIGKLARHSSYREDESVRWTWFGRELASGHGEAAKIFRKGA